MKRDLLTSNGHRSFTSFEPQYFFALTSSCMSAYSRTVEASFFSWFKLFEPMPEKTQAQMQLIIQESVLAQKINFIKVYTRIIYNIRFVPILSSKLISQRCYPV